MATGFGFSVGDFVAGINLVKDVIKALQDAAGSSKEYLELVTELRTLEIALLEVKALDLQIEQRAQRAALRHAATQCQTSIDNFLKDLTKYSSRLRLGGSQCAWKDAYRKIQWRLCKRDDLVRFRDEIGFHVQSIQMLMLTIQINSTSLHTESLRTQSTRLDDQSDALQDIQATVKNALSSFQSLRECIGRYGSIQGCRLTEIERTAQANLYETKPFDSSSTNSISMASLQCVKMMQDVCNALPPQIERQQPVTFRDALNRVAPIHLEWINSREAFFAVLEVRFRDLGMEKVKRREFALQKAGARTDIDLKTSWEAWFCPGQRVDMSMTFKQQGSANMAMCPACQSECVGDMNTDIECPNCTRSFRRVIDMTEDTQERTDSLQMPRSAPVARCGKRKLEDGESRDEIYCYQRIRVLCRQRKISSKDEGTLMTCNKIWDRLQSMERFRNGEMDVDLQCAKLRSKARASERGVVVDEKEVDRILGDSDLLQKQDQANRERVSLASSELLGRRPAMRQERSSGLQEKSVSLTSFTSSSESSDGAKYTIQCFCGISEDDGNTVFCANCGTWQHITCFYPNQMVPDVHVCTTCERNASNLESTHQQKRSRGAFYGFHDDREPDLVDGWQ